MKPSELEPEARQIKVSQTDKDSGYQQQCLLAATAQNIKKIALLLSKNCPETPSSVLQTLLSAYIQQLRQYQQIALLHNAKC